MSGRKPNNYVFVLGDKLATMHEAAISIYSVSKKDSESRDKAVHAYAVALQDVWHKSFGEKHVIGLKPIKKRLRDILTSYNRNVLLESYRKTDKHSGSTKGVTSIRSLNKIWRNMEVPMKKNAKKSLDKLTYNDLLDVGKNTEILEGREKSFYEDQKKSREGRLSEEIDDDYETQEVKISGKNMKRQYQGKKNDLLYLTLNLMKFI